MVRGYPDWKRPFALIREEVGFRGERELSAYQGFEKTFVFFVPLDPGETRFKTIYIVPSGRMLLIDSLIFTQTKSEDFVMAFYIAGKKLLDTPQYLKQIFDKIFTLPLIADEGEEIAFNLINADTVNPTDAVGNLICWEVIK